MTHHDPQKFARSPEQEAFRAKLSSDPAASVILKAYAGSGKTATIIDSLDVISQQGSTALMAFNKKMAVELEERVGRLAPAVRFNTEVGTCHSFGFAAWRQSGRKSRVQGGKLSFLLEDLFEEHRVPKDYEDPRYASRGCIRRLCSFAKNAGFGLSSSAERFPSLHSEQDWLRLIDHFNVELELDGYGLSLADAVQWCQRLMEASNACERMIDFDDMIYLSLLKNCKVRQFKNVVVDEAQDTNATRREFAFRSLMPGGRLIAVGDPHQAIYGFTGADSEALANMGSRSQAVTLPLSVCWRCDQRIIEHAQRWVPGIRSFDNEGKGSVESIEFDEQFLDRLTDGDAVLCRLNRPNVSVAIALLRRGRNARIEGRDLGARLMEHARKASPDKPELERLKFALETYGQHQTQLLLAHDKDKEAALLDDELDALDVLIERCLEQGQKSFAQLETLCNELFVDEAHKQRCILLSSIHKAKGLEWDRVYLLGRSDYMPFFKAEQAWELEQEDNLCYVAVTRARHELIEVCDVQAALDKGLHRSPARAKPESVPEPATQPAAAPPWGKPEPSLDDQLAADLDFMLQGINLRSKQDD